MKWISSLPVVFLSCSMVVQACPFCGGPPTQTWSELVAEADVVVLAELIAASEGSNEKKPFSVVRLVRVHKGENLLSGTKQVRVPEYLPGQPGELFVLNASLRDEVPPEDTFVEADVTGATGNVIKKVSATDSDIDNAGETTGTNRRSVLVWDLNQQMAESTFNYIIGAPQIDQPVEVRLRYFAQFLESQDDTIAVDAWSEFANSKYEHVVAVKDSLDAKKLRTWISDKNASPERLGLYGMMLGLCGNENDALFLRRQIGQPVNDLRFGVDGLMGGYLLLASEPGLEFIQEAWLKNTNASTFDAMAAMKAIQFIWAYEPELFQKQRLRESLYPVLAREDLREIVITDLARWEDWSAVSKMPDIYDQSKASDTRTATAVVKYLLTLRAALEEKTDNQYLKEAGKLLDRIRSENPRLVRTAERFFN